MEGLVQAAGREKKRDVTAFSPGNGLNDFDSQKMKTLQQIKSYNNLLFNFN